MFPSEAGTIVPKWHWHKCSQVSLARLFPSETNTNILKWDRHDFSQVSLALTVCSCHVTYAFQSESTLYSCLNVKELLARSRREIWSLSDCNWTWTQSHLVRKRPLNQFCPNGWVFVYELSGFEFDSSCSHLRLARLFPSETDTIVAKWNWHDCSQVNFDFLICNLFYNLFISMILHRAMYQNYITWSPPRFYYFR